jgi:hypothetical protein
MRGMKYLVRKKDRVGMTGRRGRRSKQLDDYFKERGSK